MQQHRLKIFEDSAREGHAGSSEVAALCWCPCEHALILKSESALVKPNRGCTCSDSADEILLEEARAALT